LLAAILRLIRGAGKTPVERDALYQVIREFNAADDGSVAHAA